MIVSSVATTDQPLQIRSHRDSRSHLQLNPIFGDGVQRRTSRTLRRTIDDLGIDAGLHGFQHVSAGQINRRRLLKGQANRLRLVGSNQGSDDQRNISARQVVSLERFAGDARRLVQPRLNSHDFRAYHDGRIDLSKTHAEQIKNADPRAGRNRLDPQPKIGNEHIEDDQANDDDHRSQHDSDDAT